jgi:hypothetical protein
MSFLTLAARRDGGAKVRPGASDSLSDDAMVEETFQRFAADLFETPDRALLEAKRMLVSFISEYEALKEYAKEADMAAALGMLDRRTDLREPMPGDELPEGYAPQ